MVYGFSRPTADLDGAGFEAYFVRAPLPEFLPRTLFSDLQLPEVLVRIAAAAIKKHRIESEEWARRREEEAKQREEQHKRAEEHKRKAECITELMENWEQAQRIRAFSQAITEAAKQLDLPDEKRQEIQQVLDWTKEYAESLDPLIDLSDSIEEFVHPERKHSWLKW